MLQEGCLPPKQVTINGAKVRLKPIAGENSRLRYTIVKVYDPETGTFAEQFDERILSDLNMQP
jgi:hypothetical protein